MARAARQMKTYLQAARLPRVCLRALCQSDGVWALCFRDGGGLVLIRPQQN